MRMVGGSKAAVLAAAMLMTWGGAQGQPGASKVDGRSIEAVPERAATQIIVRYKDDKAAAAATRADRIQALSARAGAALSFKRAMADGAHVLVLPKGGLPRAEAFAVAKRIEADPAVRYAEIDAWMRPTFAPNDPLYAGNGSAPKGQWHYKNPGALIGSHVPAGAANLPTAWDTSTGQNVVVAVIDTGAVSHSDLNANIIGGYDFVSNVEIANDGDGRDADYSDPGDWVTQADVDAGGMFADCTVGNSSWHGTHVAGTIAAVTNNATGVAGVAFNARLIILRALGKCGGFTSDIADAIRWAAGLSVPGVPANSNKAQVVNMSLGGNGACSQTYQNAVNAATNAGTLVVAATGNDGVMTNDEPANCQGVLAVSALTYEGDSASYANVGLETKISAPGGGSCSTASNASFTCLSLTGAERVVWSTANSGSTSPSVENYRGYNGTSMATPHVAGVAALIYARQHGLKPAAAISVLANSARPFPIGSYCDQFKNATDRSCGAGMLDATQALVLLASRTPTVTATAPTLVVNGSTVVLHGTAAPNNGGSAAFSYAWTQLSGTAVSLQNANQADASFVAPTPGGNLQFRLTVTDANGYVASATTTLRSNGAPTVNAVATQTVTAGSALSFSVSAADPEGDAVTYVATGLPAGATLNAANGAFSWPNAGPAGNYSFTVAASDGYATGPAVTVNITVNAAGGGGGGGGAVGALGLVLLAFAALGLRRNRVLN